MENKMTKQGKLYTASTQMTPVIYKDFYKTYYKQKLGAFNVISVVIAAIAIIAAIYLYSKGFGILWAVIAAWAGVFVLVYPRMLYRKPYKRSKDASQTTHFTFYENFMTEKSKSYSEEYEYGKLEKVLESNKYFFIFHNSDSVSIVDKNSADNADMLSEFLRTKTKYKRIKP